MESKKLKTIFDKETNAAIGAFGKYVHDARIAHEQLEALRQFTEAVNAVLDWDGAEIPSWIVDKLSAAITDAEPFLED